MTEKYSSRIEIFRKAYPEFIVATDFNSITWKDGTQMIFDDGVANKTFEQMLEQPDLEDQLLQSYPKGKNYKIPTENQDPGRIRNEKFFRKMYGENEKEVEKRLVEIVWLPKHTHQKLRISSVNQVAQRLQLVSNELDSIFDKFGKYIDNPGGTFVWRFIAGTSRLSTHSYGIAIDINVEYSNYWLWNKKSMKYQNQIPLEIVEIFENHGFIWGGKWYHYDTMHFEYRPELLN